MRFNRNQFSFDPKTYVYSAEMSTLGIGSVPREVVLHWPETGEQGLFMFTHVDRDASGEDIAGWNYKVTMGAVENIGLHTNSRVLIIND